MNKKEKEEKKKDFFSESIDDYLHHLDSLHDVVPLTMELLYHKLAQEFDTIDDYIKINKFKKKAWAKGWFIIPPWKIKEFISLVKNTSKTSLAYKVLPNNFIVALVSQYDAFLGNLLRNIYTVKDELLNASEKSISFTELLKISSIEETKEFIIEKEVESFLRDSHLKQFTFLENKLGMTLRKDLENFKNFIEITERRNLFVHCNWVVSRQYLENCIANQVEWIEKIKLWEKLWVDDAYFSHCYKVLFEIWVKLGQVVWRKLIPTDLEKADGHLNDICFQLLVKWETDLALNLLNFATDTLKKHHDEVINCVFTINKALAYYISWEKDKCNAVLDSYDWSATHDRFKLAGAVLKENYPGALKIMKKIWKEDDHINKDAYREWPLFCDFRKTPEFKDLYKNIFNEDFVYIEKEIPKLENIFDGIKKRKKKK